MWHRSVVRRTEQIAALFALLVVALIGLVAGTHPDPLPLEDQLRVAHRPIWPSFPTGEEEKEARWRATSERYREVYSIFGEWGDYTPSGAEVIARLGKPTVRCRRPRTWVEWAGLATAEEAWLYAVDDGVEVTLCVDKDGRVALCGSTGIKDFAARLLGGDVR